MNKDNSKFEVFLVESDIAYQQCIAVLEKVRYKELNRVAGQSVLDSNAFTSTGTDYSLVACRDVDSGLIIGCVKLTKALELANIPSSCQEYELELFPESILNKLVISTRLAVLPEYRNSSAALILMSYSFKIHLDSGGLGMLGTCEPSLFPMYLKLGLRPIGQMHNSNKSGYRVPLLAYLDLTYFKEIRSPAYRLFMNENEEIYKQIKDWHNDHLANGFDENNIRISYYTPEKEDLDLYEQLINGISKQGVMRLLRNALHIQCAKGDVIIPEHDGGKFMGIVYKGAVCVLKEGRQIAKLQRGQLFGELAAIRGGNRSAWVKAENDDTEVLILATSALKLPRVEDELILWKNLANILAERLLAMND